MKAGSSINEQNMQLVKGKTGRIYPDIPDNQYLY